MSISNTPYLTGTRNKYYKICDFKCINESVVTKSTAVSLTFKILNAKGDYYSATEEIMINFEGKIFSERSCLLNNKQNAYIATCKYIDPNNSGIPGYDYNVEVFLVSEDKCDYWELYLLNKVNTDLITSPSPHTLQAGQAFESILSSDRIVISNGKTGQGCVGELKVNNNEVVTRDQVTKSIGINVKFPPSELGLKAAVGNGITDDTEVIQNIYNKLKKGETLIIPPSEYDSSGNEKGYLITNLIFDKDEVHIDCKGLLMQSDSDDVLGAAVTIGKTNSISRTYDIEGVIKLKRKNGKNWSKDNIGLKLLNVRGGIFTVDIEDFTQNLLLEGNGNGCALNSIYIKKLHNGQKNISFKAVNKGWANENKFFGGQLGWAKTGSLDDERYQIYIPYITPEMANDPDNPHSPGRYQINNNIFFSPCLESSRRFGGTLIYCGGNYNTFYSPRLEISEPETGDGTKTVVTDLIEKSHNNNIVFPYIMGYSDISDQDRFKDTGKYNNIFGYKMIDLKETQLIVNTIKETSRRKSTTISTEAGWYRIAQSPRNVSLLTGIFSIEATLSSVAQSICSFIASTSHTKEINLLQLNYSHFSDTLMGITEARIVYPNNYLSNYAYLEVYKGKATVENIKFNIELTGSIGWSLIDPEHVSNDMPTDYSSKEITFHPGIVSVNGFRGPTNGVKAINTLSSTTTVKVDLSSNGNIYNLSPDKNTTFAITNNSIGENTLKEFEVWIMMPATVYTVNWFSGVTWVEGSAPILTANKTHVFKFRTTDGTAFIGKLEYKF